MYWWPALAGSNCTDEARGCTRARRIGHGAHAGTSVWEVSRGRPLTRELAGSLLGGSQAAKDDDMAQQFVGAAIQPVAGTVNASRMSAGEPGLPRQFRRGQQTVRIVQVLKSGRETGPCRHGSGERYVRKHWYEVLAESGETMKIYFERQPRSRRSKARWWLFSIDKPQEAEGTG